MIGRTPDPTAAARIAPTLAAEHERLLDLVSRLLRPEEALERDSARLELVKKWRKVFGKDPDFARPIFERANILAATCLITGGPMLRHEEFDWAIVDEAGRATPPELLVPLVRARRSVIVGDERQLPPMLDEELAADLLAGHDLAREGLTRSLFEALVAQGRADGLPAVEMLTIQHRMHPAIGRLISDVFYDGKLEHGVGEQEREHGIDWLPRAVVWASTSDLDARFETRRGSSYYNRAEVDALERLARRLEASYRALGEVREVAIISPYQAQIAELQSHLLPHSAFWRSLRIEIATVDAFQGRDCDIVLYSTVRSNRKGALGFLRDRRRLNVALSRARRLLVVVGDLIGLERAYAGGDGNPYLEVARYLRRHPGDCAIRSVEEVLA